MEIKRVTVEDAEALLKIYAPYVEKTAITFEVVPPSLSEFKERIVNISSKYPYIKAVDDNGDIVGYAYAGAFKGRKAYDWSVETTIYIREDRRETGLGAVLYTKLEEALKSMGILNANACIACPKGEDPYLTDGSIKFHEKRGYKLVGCFHDCANKFGRWYNMVWMEKALAEHKDSPEPVRFSDWKI